MPVLISPDRPACRSAGALAGECGGARRVHPAPPRAARRAARRSRRQGCDGSGLYYRAVRIAPAGAQCRRFGRGRRLEKGGGSRRSARAAPQGGYHFRAGVGCVQLGRTLPTLSPKVVARLHSASKLLVLRRKEAPPNPVSPGSTTAVVAGDDPEEEEGEGGPRLPTPRASSLLLTDWSEAASRPGTTSGETASIARTHRRSTAVNESHSFRGAAVVSRSSQPSATCSMSTPSGSRRHRSTISPAINTDSRGHSSHPAAQIGSARPGACTQPEAEERITLPSAAGGVRRRAAMRKSLRLGCVGHYSRRAANMSGEALAWTATAPSFLALGPHESAVRTVTFCCLGVFKTCKNATLILQQIAMFVHVDVRVRCPWQ